MCIGLSEKGEWIEFKDNKVKYLKKKKVIKIVISLVKIKNTQQVWIYVYYYVFLEFFDC